MSESLITVMSTAFDQPHTHLVVNCSTVTVPTIDGSSELVVPPLTMGNDVLRMREKGIRDPRGRTRGDQLVSVRWVAYRAQQDSNMAPQQNVVTLCAVFARLWAS